MLRNCKGFTLPEFFLSFSVWIIITLFFIPAYIHLLKQFQQMEDDLLANYIFYEYLQDLRLGETDKERDEIEREGTVFRFIWKGEEEVCLYYENIFHSKQEICENYE